MSREERAAQRRRDRALAPVSVAQLVQIPVMELARAMRQAQIEKPLTDSEAMDWLRAPDTAPGWFTALVADRLAREAQAEYRRQQEREWQQMQELVAEQSARAKIEAGEHCFTSDERVFVEDWAFRAAKELIRSDEGIPIFDQQALLAIGVNPCDHSTWLLHIIGCDGKGAEGCHTRIEQVRLARRVARLIESADKESRIRQLALPPGQFVTIWHGARIGSVVKINKVSVRVRFIRTKNGQYEPVEQNLDPRWVETCSATPSDLPPTGETVTLRDHGGHAREAMIVRVEGPLFEATYSLKSGQWRSSWFDLTALRHPPSRGNRTSD